MGGSIPSFSQSAWLMRPITSVVHAISGFKNARSITSGSSWQSTLVMGRINQADWLKEGIEPPMPADWSYALKLLPVNIDLAEATKMLSNVRREHSLGSWVYGTPKEVAAKLQGYVDAGVSWVLPLDFLPMVLPPEDAATSINRSIEVCRILKANAKS